MTIDELIIRVARNEATDQERRRVNKWRRELLENEEHYQEALRAARLSNKLPTQLKTTPRPARDIALCAEQRARAQTIGSRREQGGKWPWKPVGGIAGAAIAAVIVAMIVRPWPLRSGTIEADGQRYETELDEQRTIALSDGTLVHLAPATRLDVIRDQPEPEFWLDGRAFFGVPKDNGRRVVVRTPAGSITVLGTRFDVRSNHNDLQLLVIDGRVSVSDGAHEIAVSSGELSLVNSGAIGAVVRVEDPFEYLAWMGATMFFQATPLEQVAREIEARYHAQIDVRDPSISNRTVTTSFDGQEFEEVIRIVCGAVQARCSVTGRSVAVEAL
ncbi:MAG: DUF4974 domain-containing protein [Gemmatimonas sp.]|nr:DUF4974 domain-containing protein [Gemmatimonas sp.]